MQETLTLLFNNQSKVDMSSNTPANQLTLPSYLLSFSRSGQLSFFVAGTM